MTIYTEKFQNSNTMNQGSLRVMKRSSGKFCITAYIGCEYPEVLTSGTIEDCRSNWNTAKTWIKNQMGI